MARLFDGYDDDDYIRITKEEIGAMSWAGSDGAAGEAGG